MKQLFTFACLLFVISLQAQPNLKPSIGVATLPLDTDTICPIPVFTGDFDTSGHAIGDTIPDFTLYTTTGLPVNMQNVLSQGKPVLLIGGNLTCPVFRNQMMHINTIASTYANDIAIYIVYGVEAHPTDPSPYSGQVWLTSQNQSEGVLQAQPTTYGERKALVDTLTNMMAITPTILVDEPCNAWWSNFGPAPNNAYLIDTNGVVFEKQGWFHRAPQNMYCALDSLLGTNYGLCQTLGNNGFFTFSYDVDTIDYGAAGVTLAVHATLTNTSSTDNVVLDVIRWSVNTPQYWQTAMCLDVCLAPNVDTTMVTIPPNFAQPYTFYFYTDPLVGGIGSATVGFRNQYDNNNKMFRTFWGETSKGTSISTIENEETVTIFPNPSNGQLHLTFDQAITASLQIINLQGQVVQSYPPQEWEGTSFLDLQNLSKGVYCIRLENAQQNIRIHKQVVLYR